MNETVEIWWGGSGRWDLRVKSQPVLGGHVPTRAPETVIHRQIRRWMSGQKWTASREMSVHGLGGGHLVEVPRDIKAWAIQVYEEDKERARKKREIEREWEERAKASTDGYAYFEYSGKLHRVDKFGWVEKQFGRGWLREPSFDLSEVDPVVEDDKASQTDIDEYLFTDQGREEEDECLR